MVGHVGRQLHVLARTVQSQSVLAGFSFGVHTIFRHDPVADVKGRVVEVFFKFIACEEGIRRGYACAYGQGCRGSIHRSIHSLDGVIICLSLFGFVVHKSRVLHVACDDFITLLRIFRTQHGVGRGCGVCLFPCQEYGGCADFGFQAGGSIDVADARTDAGRDEAPELRCAFFVWFGLYDFVA